MKKYILFVLLMVSGFAIASPPQPRPPGPPGLSIDNGIVVLFFLSVIFAFLILSKTKLKFKKFSIK